MNLILFDDQHRDEFLPLVWTRPVAKLRWGISTLEEKWSSVCGIEAFHLTTNYLHYPAPLEEYTDSLYVNGRYYPTDGLVRRTESLASNHAIYHGNNLVALKTNEELDLLSLMSYSFEKIELAEEDAFHLEKITDLFAKNGKAIEMDIKLMAPENGNAPDCQIIGEQQNIYVGKNVKMNALSINVEDGPIFIGDNVEIMEGAMLRGPLAICESATIKMGAKIYGDTTIGPFCKVGGEVSNSNFQCYSNKAHDGFLGNSIIGQWCNLGADTNNSNLKNNYSEVKLYDYSSGGYKDTKLTFCGLIMGDHSKAAINTQFNTGTVVGVHSNVFGAGFPAKFIPDFSWGTEGEKFDFDKACKVASKVMARRGLVLDQEEIDVYRHIFNLSSGITA